MSAAIDDQIGTLKRVPTFARRLTTLTTERMHAATRVLDSRQRRQMSRVDTTAMEAGRAAGTIGRAVAQVVDRLPVRYRSDGELVSVAMRILRLAVVMASAVPKSG